MKMLNIMLNSRKICKRISFVWLSQMTLNHFVVHHFTESLYPLLMLLSQKYILTEETRLVTLKFQHSSHPSNDLVTGVSPSLLSTISTFSFATTLNEEVFRFCKKPSYFISEFYH